MRLCLIQDALLPRAFLAALAIGGWFLLPKIFAQAARARLEALA